jgi:NAD(P)H-dependent FMN reductase
MTPRILAFAGSTRRESFNKKLVQNAVNGAREAGAEVTLLDLKEIPLPLFDQDLESEQGMPHNGATIKELFISHDGLLIASPEYNSSITGVLKNAIDWVSRPAPGEPPLVAFRGKVATLMSASPGVLGGLRGLIHLRSILSNLGVIVLPDQIAVAKAQEALKSDGSLTDPKQQASIEALGKTLTSFVMKLKA